VCGMACFRGVNRLGHASFYSASGKRPSTMFIRVYKTVINAAQLLLPSYAADLSTPVARRWSRWHFLLGDQGWLRVLWTNFYEISTDVYRSNQPSPERLARYKTRGIRAVLNLRGGGPSSYHVFEKEACETLGLCLESIHFRSNALPSRDDLKLLETHFRTLQKPFVLHCKSGADRAGFAAALYLMLIDGEPVEIATRQLSFKYLHIKASNKGIFDYCLETYRKTNEAAPVAFRDWLMTEYDPIKIEAAFKSQRFLKKVG